MSAYLALVRRELRASFRTSLFYLVAVPLLVAFGWSFYGVFVGLRTAELARYFNIVQYLLVAVTPILGMRAFAEERRSGSLQLLFAHPLGDLTLVGAKFTGVVAQQLVLLAPIAFFVPIVSSYGDLDGGAIGAQAGGTVLAGLMLAALSIAASALTRSQMVAAAIAVSAGFVVWFADISEPVSGRGVVDLLGARSHLEAAGSGLISGPDCAFFLAWTLVWLLVARLGLVSARGSA